jgi:hypothetical protein
MITHRARSKAAAKAVKIGLKCVKQRIYDHPYDLPLEHALNIDFVNEAKGQVPVCRRTQHRRRAQAG